MSNYGPRHGKNAKISEEMACEIAKMRDAGHSVSETAERFHVAKKTVERINSARWDNPLYAAYRKAQRNTSHSGVSR